MKMGLSHTLSCDLTIMLFCFRGIAMPVSIWNLLNETDGVRCVFAVP